MFLMVIGISPEGVIKKTNNNVVQGVDVFLFLESQKRSPDGAGPRPSPLSALFQSSSVAVHLLGANIRQ